MVWAVCNTIQLHPLTPVSQVATGASVDPAREAEPGSLDDGDSSS